jgi:hypothetical protein
MTELPYTLPAIEQSQDSEGTQVLDNGPTALMRRVALAAAGQAMTSEFPRSDSRRARRGTIRSDSRAGR